MFRSMMAGKQNVGAEGRGAPETPRCPGCAGVMSTSTGPTSCPRSGPLDRRAHRHREVGLDLGMDPARASRSLRSRWTIGVRVAPPTSSTSCGSVGPELRVVVAWSRQVRSWR